MLPSPASPVAHPRRPPAHLSVSLRHESSSPVSSACSRKAQAALVEETRKSGLAWRVSPVRRSSHDSNGSSDCRAAPAERWFDRSNMNTGTRLSLGIVDDDLPFFLPNQNFGSSNPTRDTERLYPPARSFDHTAFQSAPELVHAATNGSSVDDFRSVIDDLTIENKKLKERLWKYEASYSAHLEKDKLFEVKIHKLPPRKKRELEETLHAFASSIGKDESIKSSSSQLALGDASHPDDSLRHTSKNASPLSTSNSRLVDSAYTSLSISRPISSSNSNYVGVERTDRDIPAGSKIGNVQSFLADIPQGLLPKHSTVMTKRGKKKLVIRRLEQLFTGKIKVSGGQHSQPLQQQEWSKSAARDERQVIEGRGKQVSAEGVREAHILPTETIPDKSKLPKLSGRSSRDLSSTGQAEGAGRYIGTLASPNQRPTRPLDLDPDRAQVPAENIEYIRHLGLSTPLMTAEDSTDAVDVPADDDCSGWVYLNLLINMAQLHIINVTPDFVRSAVVELSTKFQLSRDGRKIRWMGGTQGTELSSDSGADNALRPSPNDGDRLDENSKKRRRIDASPHQIPGMEQTLKQRLFSSVPISALSRNQPSRTHERRNALQYKPLFRHQLSTPDDEISLDEGISHISYSPGDENGTGRTSNGPNRRSHSGSLSKRRRDDGAIVFYSGAPFCTDLSGDRENISTPLYVADVDRDGFSNHTHDALGCEPRPLPPSRTPSGSMMRLRPFKDYSICTGPLLNNESRSRTPELVKHDTGSDFEFSPKWTATGHQENLTLLRLDASGLGGTQPADHFAVTVETSRPRLDGRSRTRLSKFSKPGPKTQRFLHNILKSSIDEFRLSDTDESITAPLPVTSEDSQPPSQFTPPAEPPLEIKVLSARVQYLSPSELPPPATYHSAFSSPTECSDDKSSDDSRDCISCLQHHPLFVHREPSTSADYSIDQDEFNQDSSLRHGRQRPVLNRYPRSYSRSRSKGSRRKRGRIRAGNWRASCCGATGGDFGGHSGCCD